MFSGILARQELWKVDMIQRANYTELYRLPNEDIT